MTVTTTAAHRPGGRPLKSPLAAHSYGTSVSAAPQAPAAAFASLDDCPRALTLSDFADYLRTTNNRQGRPFEEATVDNYVYAARALDAWMTTEGIDGDFTVADTAMLNRFLRAYFQQHGQGGTHSQQRNMRHLFTYLQREKGHPHPYTENLQRYAEQDKRRPATLADDHSSRLWWAGVGHKFRSHPRAAPGSVPAAGRRRVSRLRQEM